MLFQGAAGRVLEVQDHFSFREAHGNAGPASVVSTSMAMMKLPAAGPTTGIPGELTLFGQEIHTRAHGDRGCAGYPREAELGGNQVQEPGSTSG